MIMSNTNFRNLSHTRPRLDEYNNRAIASSAMRFSTKGPLITVTVAIKST